MYLLFFLTALSLLLAARATTCEPPIAFPVPKYSKASLLPTFQSIKEALKHHFSDPALRTGSIALQVASSSDRLWEFYHTFNHSAPVNGGSVFRAASQAKILTSLAVLRLHAEGKIKSLDDPITKYIEELEEQDGEDGEDRAVQWGHVSIADLLNHRAGMLDKYAQSDFLADLPRSVLSAIGLPEVSNETLKLLPECEVNYTVPCDEKGLLSALRSMPPVLPPHTQASNSNAGYSLLGVLIAQLTRTLVEDYLDWTIIQPLGLNSTAFYAPDKAAAPIPEGRSLWDWDMGVNNPSSGLYTSADDLSSLLQWVLKNYNTIHPTINWLTPGFLAAGSHSYIGMPWQIFRTNTLSPKGKSRPVTIYTVEGWLGLYLSYAILIPEYDLIVSILMNGRIGDPHRLLDMITKPLIAAAEEVALRNLEETYATTYTSEVGSVKASIVLRQSRSRALYVDKMEVGGVQVLDKILELNRNLTGLDMEIYYRLIPMFTSRRRNGTKKSGDVQLGEVWRIQQIFDVQEDLGWNDYCISSFDAYSYAGQPTNEVIFWMDRDKNAMVEELEIKAFNLSLKPIPTEKAAVQTWLWEESEL